MHASRAKITVELSEVRAAVLLSISITDQAWKKASALMQLQLIGVPFALPHWPPAHGSRSESRSSVPHALSPRFMAKARTLRPMTPIMRSVPPVAARSEVRVLARIPGPPAMRIALPAAPAPSGIPWRSSSAAVNHANRDRRNGSRGAASGRHGTSPRPDCRARPSPANGERSCHGARLRRN